PTGDFPGGVPGEGGGDFRGRGRPGVRGGSGPGGFEGERGGGRFIPLGGEPSATVPVDAQAALDQLNKVAMLTPPPGQARKSTATVTITWWAAFLPPEPPPAEGAATNGAPGSTAPAKTGGGS
ncbi:MAG: hypothetical protein WC718_08130, partial [Phycisphaerales bacterium]